MADLLTQITSALTGILSNATLVVDWIVATPLVMYSCVAALIFPVIGLVSRFIKSV